MEQFYTKLSQISFYRLHPSYLPFIGADYEAYRILHIGESHYCSTMDVEQYNINYFSNWFEAACPEVETDLLHNNITRRVAKGVVENGDRFSIFDNVLRSFLKIVVKEQNPHISRYNRCNYNYFAFMNFYPFPAFEDGGSFIESINAYSKKHNLQNEAGDLIHKCEYYATQIVDSVIDILEPRCIVFTSCDAGYAYQNNAGKYRNDPRVIFTSHPAKPYTWNKPLPSLNNQKGIDVFERGLRNIYCL